MKQKTQNSIFLKTFQIITQQNFFDTVKSLEYSKALHADDKFVHMFQNWYIQIEINEATKTYFRNSRQVL